MNSYQKLKAKHHAEMLDMWKKVQILIDAPESVEASFIKMEYSMRERSVESGGFLGIMNKMGFGRNNGIISKITEHYEAPKK